MLGLKKINKNLVRTFFCQLRLEPPSPSDTRICACFAEGYIRCSEGVGGTLIFSYICRVIFLVQNFDFNILLGISENMGVLPPPLFKVVC